MGKQEFFQEEIYRLNREVRRFSSLGEIDRPIILSAFNSSNRAVNYFPVRDDTECRRWSFDNEEKDTIEAFLKSKEDEFKKFLDYFEPGFKDQTDDLHSFLINLYNNFPVNPNFFLDGIIRRFLSEFVRKGHLISYAFVNLLHKKSKELDFNYFPWVDVRFFYNVPPNRHHGMGAIADQESARAVKYGEWFGKNHGPADEVIAEIKQERAGGFQLEPFFFKYLQPLFMGYEKKGEVFRGDDFFSLKEQEFTRFAYLLILPFYDAWLDEKPCGSLKGNILIPFEDDPAYEKRREFIKNYFERFSLWSQTLNELLFESRSHSVLRLPVQFGDDSLKDFLSKIAFVQDWEKVRIFSKSELGCEPEYCFKRESDELWKYKEQWNLCRPGKHCLSCLPVRLKGITISDIQREPVMLGGSDTNGHLFFVDMKDLLDPKVLPSIEPTEMASYGDHVLCFEFSKDTYFPGKNSIKRENVMRLGKYYIHQMIPVLDKVLLKNKVIKHSINSAVAAIISRNHSHHIGSHVIPRTSVNQIKERMNILKCKVPKDDDGKDDVLRAINDLKSKLDGYIQKKADFAAEISTEPLITTKTMYLFNQVLLDFICNTLLMDNLGASESVKYQDGNCKDNRLRIRFNINDQESKVTFKGHPGSGLCEEVTNKQFPYTGFCNCRSPASLQLIKSGKDIRIAVPGPLGECAFYSFLENFIRNSIKHNKEYCSDLSKNMDIFINISEFPDIDIGNEFYRCEVWEEITDPNNPLKITIDGEDQEVTLQQFIGSLIKSSIIDDNAQFRKGAWGIAEMQIMATLLGGSADFTNMQANLKVESREKHGREVLVYEFRVMKPKDIAIVSNDFQGSKEKEGIWLFSSLENFKFLQEHSKSAAAFDFVLFDDCGLTVDEIKRELHLLPCRILIHERIADDFLGACKVNDKFMSSVKMADSDSLKSMIWNRWIEYLRKRHSVESARVSVFFQQNENDSPTDSWLKQMNEFALDKNRSVAASVIYMSEKGKNRITPEGKKEISKETHFVFDRHFTGYEVVGSAEEFRENNWFHEAFDKNSSDFVPIYSSQPSELALMIYKLAEAALIKILIIDERIAEVAHKKIMTSEEKANGFYKPATRLNVARFANIFIATHLDINNTVREPVHQNVEGKSQKVCVNYSWNCNLKNNLDLSIFWHNNGNEQPERITDFDVLIIHHGIIENILKKSFGKEQQIVSKDDMEWFLESLRQYIPYIVIDSGRGIPSNLPEREKFLPFSLIENYLMRDQIAKYSLSKVIMSLIRRERS